MMALDSGPCPKVLVAYYSYSGNTKKVAQRLREKTCGVLYPVDTVMAYSNRTVIEDAKRELQQGTLPALKHSIPPMTAYDAIFVGGPVWWYTVATPLMRFLQGADFAGRKVAAFCTHEGGPGSYFADFQKQARNAELLDGLELYTPGRRGIEGVDDALSTWLGRLGLLHAQSSAA